MIWYWKDVVCSCPRISLPLALLSAPLSLSPAFLLLLLLLLLLPLFFLAKTKGPQNPAARSKGPGALLHFLALSACPACLACPASALLLPCFCPASARLGSPDEKDEAEGRQGHSRARRGEARRCYDGCTRTRTRTAGYKRLLAAAVWPGEELRSESRLLQWVRAWMWKRWLWAL